MLASHRCSGEWFDVAPEMAVAAIAGAAHKLGQPILPVTLDVSDQILSIASAGGTEPPKWRLEDSALFLFGLPLIGGLLAAYYVVTILNP
jgi:hypothetical protein